ncbi:UNVERIFIED_CONTAM: hypothetical protein FKN15_023469 [Acipenser sinensis]
MQGHETAQEIFSVLHGYIKDSYILFDRMVGFCTGEAASVAGHRAGLRTLVKRVALSVVWIHCMIHREQLAAKDAAREAFIGAVTTTALRKHLLLREPRSLKKAIAEGRQLEKILVTTRAAPRD